MTETGPDLRIDRPAETVPQLVVRRVKQAILEGTLAPGRRLTERELMELTGVSRTSIREAVLHLQALGLVETSGKKGVRVAVLGSDDVRQLYEVRAALESEAVSLFVQRATDSEVLELVKLTRPGKSDDDQLASIYHFDELLLAGARNALLASTLAPLHARIHALRRLSLSIPGRRERSDQEYRDLVAAITDRDAARAAQLARHHVEAAKESALAAVAKLEEERASGA
ncbi:GntR family transcriptional regulator [Actinomadura pelletieri DSM 43383]|uniref:GntR family transcriptional regulator n=1 Tax=Actinomadura pelletieri DSM 43383 TaxID=1120940 RepID=A0A495QXW7_9ACTN|nr:GntR family transcriptional regulator [Actinomadura pelletieri]RKS78962.1 GntR family transcriptional regulator [Actinomadura pelletieri DSM 43383]